MTVPCRRPGTGIIAATLLLTLLGCQAGAGVPPVRPEIWPEGSIHGMWQAIYNGYGLISSDGGSIVLSPQPAESPDQTHAALVAATRAQDDLTVRLRTIAQLRHGTPPNPWEVGWVLWGYQDPHHFYYLALKPNGWEVGKADPAYTGEQRYLATDNSPTYSVGDWYKISLHHTANRTELWVNGTPLTTITDTERPYQSGTVALYTEDATVEFVPQL